MPSRIFPLLPCFLVLALGTWAQAPSDADCLACHSDSSLAAQKRPMPGPVISAALGREALSLNVAQGALKGSVHEGFSCVDCHTGIQELPHGSPLAEVDCGSCHSDASADLAAGTHAPRQGVAQYVPRCFNCHGAHQIKPKSDPASPTHPFRLPGTCGACHSNREVMQAAGVRVPDPTENFMKSDHWRALEGAGDVKAATCSDCHGSHKVLPSSNPDSSVHKKNVPHTCGKCHGRTQGQYEMGVHGKALKGGNLEAPSCADCHGEHDIEAKERPTSTVYGANVSRTTCPQCHASVRLSRRFNLPSGMVQSYQASFHGLANRYGATNVANCASCHGAHDILPSSDPASSIHPKNLAATCGKCHPGAGETFAKISIHQREDSAESPILIWIRRFYWGIILGTLLALGLHNLLDYVRRYLETLKLLKPVAVYLRMTLSERIQHGLLLVSFFALVITGFALKYPDSIWALPFKAVPSGFEWRGWLHRGAAVVLIGDGLFHAGYLALTKRGRRLLTDMMPALQDCRDAWGQFLYFIGKRPHGAEFGRFGYGEKVEYLALLWGTAVMVGTGFVLWFKTWFTRFLPAWGYSAAEMIHFYEAVLAFSTIVVWHLYAVFSHTERPPYNQTWLTGLMTRHDMEHHHSRELATLDRQMEEAAEGMKEDPEGPSGPPEPAGSGDTPDPD